MSQKFRLSFLIVGTSAHFITIFLKKLRFCSHVASMPFPESFCKTTSPLSKIASYFVTKFSSIHCTLSHFLCLMKFPHFSTLCFRKVSFTIPMCFGFRSHTFHHLNTIQIFFIYLILISPNSSSRLGLFHFLSVFALNIMSSVCLMLLKLCPPLINPGRTSSSLKCGSCLK